MMKLAVTMVVVVVAMAAAHPSTQERFVDNPTTANQVLDNIMERTLEKIVALGWDESKKSQNGKVDIPMHEESGTTETLEVTQVVITGLGSLTRSKSASFNADKTRLTGTIMVENARIAGDYTAQFPGVGEAPAQSVQGRVIETVDKLFADIVVNLDANLTPQSIRSYEVRSGHDDLTVTGLGDNNQMAPLHEAGFRKAMRQTLESTMAQNVKVQVNKAIQDLKAEAAA
ncbi:uncharacterized protein LOC127003302 [Eriocheir sinensis]|uniref:uncharacterized protein LOC127003302 n=1 Tax=Eriocheir sinensis TaxID=95602 RepID=UPI0021C96CE4|nr:uncharacterized protein LOC127003302 [Eriocheir sinensis]